MLIVQVSNSENTAPPHIRVPSATSSSVAWLGVKGGDVQSGNENKKSHFAGQLENGVP